jgi:hypothetical protein
VVEACGEHFDLDGVERVCERRGCGEFGVDRSRAPGEDLGGVHCAGDRMCCDGRTTVPIGQLVQRQLYELSWTSFSACYTKNTVQPRLSQGSVGSADCAQVSRFPCVCKREMVLP